MNAKTLMMLAGGGLVLYYLSNKQTAAPVTPMPGGGAGAGAGTGSGSTATANTSTTPPANPPTFNALSSIYARLTAAASGAGVTAAGAGPDTWNYYLAQVSSVTPPDPMAVFPGIDRAKPMTAAQYWAGMSDYLAKNLGMSGLGYYPRSAYWHMNGGWRA